VSVPSRVLRIPILNSGDTLLNSACFRSSEKQSSGNIYLLISVSGLPILVEADTLYDSQFVYGIKYGILGILRRCLDSLGAGPTSKEVNLW